LSTNNTLDDLFTEEGKLRHEVKYLKDRINNLEAFKKNFFKAQSELIAANERLETMQETLNMQSVKDCLINYDDATNGQANKNENEFGEIMLSFFEESILANSYQDLIMSLFQSLHGLNIDITAKINDNAKNITFALDNTTHDKNLKLIEKHKDDGECYEQDNYMVINHLYISLVVTNLDASTKKPSNHIKDYIKIVASGANSRISSLSKRFELEALKKNIYLIFKKVNGSFEVIQDNVDNQTIAISELFLDCEKNLKNTLKSSQLSSEHKQLVDLIIDTAKKDLNLLLTSSLTLDESFIKVMKKLESAYTPES